MDSYRDSSIHGITAGPQPSVLEIVAMAQWDFQSIVNLRIAGEPNQPLGPSDEAKVARKAGLSYLHLPLDMAHFSETVERHFCRELDRLPRPVFIHCNDGARAKLVLSFYLARFSESAPHSGIPQAA